MKVTVVINTYNRAKLLRDTLISLMGQTYAKFEIVVVQGPCTDDTDEILANFESRVKVRHCEVAHLGVSRNVGIAAAAGDIVAFIDDDAVADARWVERLASAYDSTEVGAVGGWVWDHTGIGYQCRYNVCDRFATTIPAINEDSSELLSVPGSWYVISTIGTNTSFRKEVLDQIGGFDEAFMYNCDETDVCLRLIDAGYRVKIISDALVYHRYAASHLRDHRRIPSTLYPASYCKSYFGFRNTLPSSLAHGISYVDEISRRFDSA